MEVVTLEGDEALRELLIGRRVSAQAWDKLYRADLFADVRFPDGHVFEDIATTHRLVMRAGRVACVPNSLVHYRERKGSIFKQHSAEILVDCWWVHLQRYEELKGISGKCRQTCVCVPQCDFEDLVLVGVVPRRR